MLTQHAAQGLVDGLSAVTLGASALAIVRRPPSLLRPRLGFAFGGIFLLFALRAGANFLYSPFLWRTTLIVDCILPLAALFLAEGVLRRHAPWLLKLLVVLGAAITAIAMVKIGGDVATWWLGGFVNLSLIGVAILLLTRDRASLSTQENAGVTALIGAGVFLIAMSISDFLPQLPLGFSGIGVSALALVLGFNPTTQKDVNHALMMVLLLAVIGLAAAFAFSGPLGLNGMDERIRLAAILMSLLLAANAVAGGQYRGSNRAMREFAQALVAADISNLDSFLNSLADQPLLGGLRIAEGQVLADYDGAAIGRAMAGRAVWTKAALTHPAIAARVRDELGDLMARTDASHAVMICQTPLRIATLILPDMGHADEFETQLGFFQKLATMAASHGS